MRIKHSDIEVLRANPKSYLRRRPPGGKFGPHTVLRLAMLRLHSDGDDISKAREYLEEMYKGRGNAFTEASLEEQRTRLNAYYESYLTCPGRACDVACRLRGLTPGGNVIAGEVARLDTGIIAASGEPYYYAWIFTPRESDWKNELRIPLIQFAVAQDLKCPVEEVAVGVYCHELCTHAWTSFRETEVRLAVDYLDRLVHSAMS